MTPRDHIQALLNHMRRLGRPMNYQELDAYGAQHLNGPGIPDVFEATQILLGQELVKASADGYSLMPTANPGQVESGKTVNQVKLIQRLTRYLSKAGADGLLSSVLINHVKVHKLIYQEAMDRLESEGQVRKERQSNGALRYFYVSTETNKDS